MISNVDFSNIFQTISRSDVVEEKLNKAVNKNVADGCKIIFMPIDCQETEHRKNNVNVYRVNLWGILPDGSKALVVLKDIDVYVDIMAQGDTTQFMNKLRGEFIRKEFHYRGMEIVQGFPLTHFQKQKSDYIRIHFNNLADRWNVINYAISNNYSTASDDHGGYKGTKGYFPKIAREFQFNTASWNILPPGKYEIIPKESDSFIATNCDYMFVIDVKDFEPLSEDEIQSFDFLNKPKIMVMTWDIETYTSDKQTGETPNPKDNNWNIFMICMTFHWQYSSNAILKVCLVDHPTPATDEIFFDTKKLAEESQRTGRPIDKIKAEQSKYNYVIECGDEKNILLAFSQIFARMAPDIITAFNGGNFDWVFFRAAAKRHGILKTIRENLSSIKPKYLWNIDDEKIYKYMFRSEHIKISPDQYDDIICVDLPGFIDTDVMIVFKKLYPKSEVGSKYSLNFYLKINKLAGKEDLPYKTMFQYYEEASKWLKDEENYKNGKVSPDFSVEEHQNKFGDICAKMQKIAKYCVVDALRCQQLLVARTVINDKREMSNMSYVSLYDSFYRADGMKVRNLVGAFCYEKGIMFSNLKSENRRIKYQGAHVFHPKRGVNRRRPVVGLDFASLYPSLIIAYNLSPEKSIVNTGPESEEYVQKLREEGYTIYETEITGHVNEPDAQDNGQPVKVRGWIVRHNMKTEETKEKPGESMGIFPHILRRLFDRRKIFKEQFKKMGKLIEKIKTLREEYPGKPDKEIFAEFITERELQDTGFTKKTLDFDNLVYMANVVDSKQKAMKIHMNTFYGEQGNNLSSLYKLLVAGAITAAGQYNILMVADYLKKNKYIVSYGDTDSNYISCPDSVFQEIDAIYDEYSAKISQKAAVINHKNITKDQREKFDSSVFRAHFAPIFANYTTRHNEYLGEFKAKKITEDYFKKLDMALFAEFCDKVYSVANSLEIMTPIFWRLLFFKLKEEYWIQLIQITRHDINKLRDVVNIMLAQDNGTPFLRMEYEEVLFPVCFLGKKKYFGFQHLEKEIIRPKPEDVFIKGVDFIRQGQTDLSRKIGMDLIMEVCDIENDTPMIDLVEYRIREIYETKWDTSYFVVSGRFKPNKKNITMHTFYNRMLDLYKKYSDPDGEHYDIYLAADYKPPEPGDPFQYVIVRRDQAYNLRGRKINLKKGDKMEYLHVYEKSQNTKNPLKIDIFEYVKGSIIGVLTRFISSDPRFQPRSIMDPEDADKYSMSAARKYIENICEKVSGFDRQEEQKRGRTFRKITNFIDKGVYQAVCAEHGRGLANILYEYPIDVIDEENKEKKPYEIITENVENIEKMARERADIMIARSGGAHKIGDRFIEKNKDKIEKNSDHLYVRLSEIYGVKTYRCQNNSLRNRKIMINNDIEKCRQTIWNNSAAVEKIKRKHLKSLKELFLNSREKFTETSEIADSSLNIVSLSEEEAAVVKIMEETTSRLAVLYYKSKFLDAIQDGIKRFRDKKIGQRRRPEIDSKKETKNSEYEVIEGLH